MMTELTQLEHFQKNVQMFIEHLEDMQHEISMVEEDFAELRVYLALLEEGKNDNAWDTYCKLLESRSGD